MPTSVSGLQSIKAQACCYVKNNEVWAARKDGSVHIYNPFSGDNVGEVSFNQSQEELWEAHHDLNSSRVGERMNTVEKRNITDQMSVVERVIKRMVVIECDWCRYKSSAPQASLSLCSSQVWAITASGDLLCFDSDKHQLIYRIKGPLEMYNRAEEVAHNEGCKREDRPAAHTACHFSSTRKKFVPALTDLVFDGTYLLVASESEAVFLIDPKLVYSPYSVVVVGRLDLLGPCEALAVMPHFLLCGDRHGRLYCFDRSTWECTCVVDGNDGMGSVKNSTLLQQLKEMVQDDPSLPSRLAFLEQKDEKAASSSLSFHTITCLLFEPTQNTVWVGRKDGCLYTYKMQKSSLSLRLERVVDPINGLCCVVEGNTFHGRRHPFSGEEEKFPRRPITSLSAMSGVVLLTTADVSLIVVDAGSGKVLNAASAPSGCLVRGIIRIRQKEEAIFWSYSHEGGVYEWRVSGLDVAPSGTTNSTLSSSSCPFAPPFHWSAEDVLQRVSGATLVDQKNSERIWWQPTQTLPVNLPLVASEERLKAVLAVESMRSIADEAQELRLQLLRTKDIMESKDLEIEKRKKHEEELQQENKELKKKFLELTSSQATSLKELAEVKTGWSATKEALSQARTEYLQLQREKSSWSADVSSIKIEKSYVEQQLMDAQNTVSGMRAENERLYRSIARMGGAEEKEYEVKKTIEATSAANSASLLQYKKLNRLLTSVMATMEYTIRRKEEEEKDLTCLLNSFRHRVTDHVTDPHLTALLQATIVRNPARFSYSCDSATLAQIQDRSEPIQRFFKVLRLEDPDAYEKLITYLQHIAITGKGSTGSGSVGTSSMGSEGFPTSAQATETSMDKFINILTQATEISDEAILSFRRSVPIMFVSDSSATPSTPSGSSTNNVPSSTTTTTTTNTMETARKAKQEEDVTLRILRDFHSQLPLDSEEMRNEQQTLEFILTTRRGFIDQVGLLYRRLQLAQMACDSIGCSTQVETSGATHLSSSSSSLQFQSSGEMIGTAGLSREGKARVHSQLITGITGELLQTLRGIVLRFFTKEEQSRVSLQDIAV